MRVSETRGALPGGARSRLESPGAPSITKEPLISHHDHFADTRPTRVHHPLPNADRFALVIYSSSTKGQEQRGSRIYRSGHSRVICIFGKELLAGILPPHARSTSRALASTVAGGCGAWLRDGKTASAARSIIPQPPAPPLPPAPTRGQCSAEPVAGPHHHRRALRGRLRCAASLFLTTEEVPCRASKAGSTPASSRG